MGINKKLLILSFFIFLFFIVSASVLSSEDIKKELAIIHLDLVEKQASLDLINKKLNNTPEEIVSTKLIRPKQVDTHTQALLNDLKTQMAEKLTIYREKHPVIKSLQTQIDYLERTIKAQRSRKEMERKVTINPEFTDLKQKKNLLETQIRGMKAKKIELEKTLKDIEKENNKEEKKKQIVNKQENKISKTSFSFLNNKKLIPALKVIIVFLILAIVLAMIYVGLKNNATRINAVITRFKESVVKKLKKGKKVKKVKNKVSDPDVIANIPKVKNTEPYDISIIDRDGEFNEVFKKISDNVKNATRSFIITPFDKGAGSTFLTVNISNIFAREGERVLVIDSDFEEPTLHRIYSVENEKGFSDILEGKDPKEVIQNTDNRLIDVITSGLNPLGAGDLFENTLFLEFISDMEKEYSRVIIDMPSLSESELSYIAGKFVPYLVVINKEEHAAICRSTAESKNNVFLGCILNKK